MPVLFALPQNQDDRIAEVVRRQLTWQTDIQSRAIHVQVENGAVLLTGNVETRLEKLEAEHAAKAVYGVSSVANRITVQPERERADCEIEADLGTALHILASILEEPPVATVKNGVATLRGRVRWNFQRHSAERAADAIIGVREVVNIIEVAPPAPCRQLARRRPRHRSRVPLLRAQASGGRSQPCASALPGAGHHWTSLKRTWPPPAPSSNQ